MAEPTPHPLEEAVRFSLDQSVDLDLAYCDLVRAREPNHAGPFELRIRGIRQPDGARVRGFVPLLEVEGGLLDAQALLTPIDTGALPPGERSFVAVPLAKHALTLTKRRKGNGQWFYEVAVRDGARAIDLAQYLRALKDAAEQAVPVLAGAGFAVGAAEIISIADTLFAARTHRKDGGAR